MADQDKQAQDPLPTPTQPIPTPEPLPSTPAPHQPVPGALDQAPLTGLAAKETLEARQKSEADRKRQESQDRYSRRSGLPPQPKKPKSGPQPAPPAEQSDVPEEEYSDSEAAPQPQAPPPQQGRAAARAAAAAHAGLGQGPQALGIGMAIPTMGNPTVQAMVMQLFNQSKLAGQEFHMVVLPEDDWPAIETYDTIEKLIEAIKGYLGTPTHIFPFVGQVMGITSGPNHHLRTPYGMLPLFSIPTEDDVEEVEYGWVGPSLQRPEAPQSYDDEIIDEAAEEAAEAQELQQQALERQATEVDQTPIFGEPLN